jgi:hypothetical protein
VRRNGDADVDTYVKSSIGLHNNVIAKIIPQKNEVGYKTNLKCIEFGLYQKSHFSFLGQKNGIIVNLN